MSVLCKVDGKEFKDEKSLHLALRGYGLNKEKYYHKYLIYTRNIFKKLRFSTQCIFPSKTYIKIFDIYFHYNSFF